MPPADHQQQDIAALRDRLTRLSRASLSINEIWTAPVPSPGSVPRQVAVSDDKLLAKFPVREASLLVVPLLAAVSRAGALQQQIAYHRGHKTD